MAKWQLIRSPRVYNIYNKHDWCSLPQKPLKLISSLSHSSSIFLYVNVFVHPHHCYYVCLPIDSEKSLTMISTLFPFHLDIWACVRDKIQSCVCDALYFLRFRPWSLQLYVYCLVWIVEWAKAMRKLCAIRRFFLLNSCHLLYLSRDFSKCFLYTMYNTTC